MAIVTKITQPGNQIISTLDGKVRIEAGRNRIVSTDAVSGGNLNVWDSQGIKTYDDDANEIARNGRQPDDSVNVAVVNPGETIEGAIS
jgi:hypothetical protein